MLEKKVIGISSGLWQIQRIPAPSLTVQRLSEFVKLKKKYQKEGKKIEIWAQDEARLGLQPVIRRTWGLKGKRIMAHQTRKFKWVYVYAFVHPATGNSFYLILPTVNTDLMTLTLKEFKKEIDPNDEKIILLIMDGAGWHRSKDFEVPEGVQIIPLPPYSPELQPVESGWPLLREPMANGHFDTLDALEKVIEKRCLWLMENPKILQGEVGFGWIREIEEGTTD